MNFIICDDCEILLNMEKEGCEQYMEPDDSLECYCLSTELKQRLLEEKPEVDLFILDIDMPEVSGLELKKIISEIYEDTNIVFVSGYDSYMKEAYGKKVIGFLSRIEYKERIGEIIEKVRNEIKNRKIIQIADGTKEHQLEQNRICFIRAQRVYSKLCYVDYYNADNNDLNLSELSYRISLREWEEQLDETEFCRINRSTILSWRYVSQVSDKIKLLNGDEYRIPAGKKKLLRQKYFHYIMKKDCF